MNVEYDIGPDQLLRLDLALAERRTGMTLWLRHLCGFILGPVGALALVFIIFERLHPTGTGGLKDEIATLVMGVFFLWLLSVAIRYSVWNLRRGIRRRIRENPKLVGKRSLYLSPNSLFEMPHRGLEGYVSAADKPAYLREHVLHSWAWSDLADVKEDRNDILLFARSGAAMIVPVRGEPPAEVQSFRNSLMAHWQSAKTGAPLPSEAEVWPPAPSASNAQEPDSRA